MERHGGELDADGSGLFCPGDSLERHLEEEGAFGGAVGLELFFVCFLCFGFPGVLLCVFEGGFRVPANC